MTVRTCRGDDCDATIRLLQSPSGSWLALNVDPDPRKGNVWVPDDIHPPRAHVLGQDAAKALRAAGEPMFRDHHASCPNADEFRRDGSRKGGG